MKKNFTLIIMLAFSISNITFAQNTFFKSYSLATQYDELFNVMKTSDNGYACVTQNGGIMKLDSNSLYHFYKQLSFDSTMYFYRIIQTTDKGYIIESSFDPFNQNAFGSVVKFDKDGNYLWTKVYYHPTPSSNSITDIISSSNNGFYLISNGCAGHLIIIKCNATGDIIWQKASGCNIAALKIAKYADDKLLIAGLDLQSNHLPIGICLVDTSGNFLWAKEYDNNQVNYTAYINFDIVNTHDYGYLITTNLKEDTITMNSGRKNVVMHIDSLGNVLWAKKIYTNDSVSPYGMQSIFETNDKGYFYIGSGMEDTTTSIARLVCTKTDSLNNIEWSRYFSDLSFYSGCPNEGLGAFQQNNNYFVFCNNIDGFALAKLDQNGNGLCSSSALRLLTENTSYDENDIPVSLYDVDFVSESHNLTFNDAETTTKLYCSGENAVIENEINNGFNYYQNPTTGKLTVEAGNMQQIEIIDMQGRIMQIINAAGKNSTSVDISETPKGIYFVKVITNKGVTVEKVIHE